MEIGFSLGSNRGNRLSYLRQAKTQLLMVPQARFIDQSSVYETEPVEVAPQHQALKFLNSVLIIESSDDPERWLERIKLIEKILGRERGTDRNAPRTIDIDILYAGDRIVADQNLEVPHPRWAGRRFVVEPLAEIRPDLILPGFGQPVQKICAQLPGQNDIRLFLEKW